MQQQLNQRHGRINFICTGHYFPTKPLNRLISSKKISTEREKTRSDRDFLRYFNAIVNDPERMVEVGGVEKVQRLHHMFKNRAAIKAHRN